MEITGLNLCVFHNDFNGKDAVLKSIYDGKYGNSSFLTYLHKDEIDALIIDCAQKNAEFLLRELLQNDLLDDDYQSFEVLDENSSLVQFVGVDNDVNGPIYDFNESILVDSNDCDWIAIDKEARRVWNLYDERPLYRFEMYRVSSLHKKSYLESMRVLNDENSILDLISYYNSPIN